MRQKSHWSKMLWKKTLNQVSTDGLSSVHIFIFLMIRRLRWTVHRQKSGHFKMIILVFLVDGPWSKIRPLANLKILRLVQCSNSSTICTRVLVRSPYGRMDRLTVRRRLSSSVEALSKWFLIIEFGSTTWYVA